MAAGDIVVSGLTSPSDANGTYTDDLDGSWSKTGGVLDYFLDYDSKQGKWELWSSDKGVVVIAYLVTDVDDDPQGGDYTFDTGGGDLEIEWWVGTPVAPTTSALKAFFKFNDAGGQSVLADSSSSPNNGTFKDSGGDDDVNSVAGKINNAVEFDGSEEYGEVPHASKLVFTNALTVGIWVNADAIATEKGLVGKYDPDDGEREWLLELSGSDSFVAHLGWSDGTYGARKSAEESGLVSTGTWVLLGFTYDGDNNDLFITFNGKRVRGYYEETGGIPSSLYSDADVAMSLACRSIDSATRGFFNGKLDCGFVYAEVFSLEKWAYVYNGGDGREDLGPSGVVATPFYYQKMMQGA